MRRCSVWVVGLCAIVTCVLNADAGAFVDPLSLPSTPTNNLIHSRLMAVAGSDQGLVAVGPLGHILVADKLGQDWTQAPSPLSTDLVAVRFVGERKVWAVGHDGVILHSEDAGQTWSRQLDGNQVLEILRGQLKGLALSTGADATRTKGELERAIADGAAKPFFDIAFLNEKEGFAVGPFNLAFHTVDGGQHWQSISELTENPEGLHLYGLAVVADKLWLVGERGLVRCWDSTTSRFQRISTPYQGSYFGIVGGRSTLLAFGMQGQAVRSTDAGRTWALVDTGSQGAIAGGTEMSDGRIVLVTLAGEVLVSRNQGASFKVQRLLKPMPYFSVAQAGPDSVALVGALGVRVESLL
ncbi:YCF48-related protein [Pseudomonas veronii]